MNLCQSVEEKLSTLQNVMEQMLARAAESMSHHVYTHMLEDAVRQEWASTKLYVKVFLKHSASHR
jgi:hypothetical protein